MQDKKRSSYTRTKEYEMQLTAINIIADGTQDYNNLSRQDKNICEEQSFQYTFTAPHINTGNSVFP